MDQGTKRAGINWLGVGLGCLLIAVGALNIVHGIRRYDLRDVLTGVGMALLAPLPSFFSAKRMSPKTTLTWRHRLALMSGCLSVAATLIAFVATVRDKNPVAWLGVGQAATVSDLLNNLLLYNNTPVNVRGYVVATDRGCALLVGDAGKARGAQTYSPTGIWLGYRRNECPITAASPVLAEVSGTFHAFRADKDRPAFYALASPIVVDTHHLAEAKP